MAIEKRWEAISPRLFTANGGLEGVVTLASTIDFKVKQQVTLKSNTQIPLFLEVKRVVSATVMWVGLPGNINLRSDLTAFLVADSATIEAAEQPRNAIPEKELFRACFAEEPISAWRNALVDQLGNYYNANNRFPVDAVVSISGSSANNPVIANIDYPTANVELSYAIPTDTKKLKYRIRGAPGKSQIAYVSGATETNFFTIMPGNIYEEVELETLPGLTLYFQVNKSGVTVEIMTWS